MAKQNRKPYNKKTNYKGKQGRKDNGQKRVNYDNTRESKFDKDVDATSMKKTSGSNDVSWYANNPELLRSAASLPFSTTTGEPLPWNLSGSYRSMPGVMTLYWVPQIGGSFIDPINQAANSTYSFVVHANSRTKSYDAPDLMQMILCGASLFSMLALGIRAYGLMRMYDQRNLYLPKALIQASGFDYEDLKENLSNMWFDLNELISRSTQIWIPNTFPFIERWFWMNSNVYMDGSSIKAQYYMFTPQSYLTYQATGDYFEDNHIATAHYNMWSGPFNNTAGQFPVYYTHTWAQYMEIMNSMFTPLLASQDRGIIFGDILKAYGADKLYALPPITSDYRVVPVYDEEVLTQIENLVLFDQTPEEIAQDPKTNLIYTSAYTPVSKPVSYPPSTWLPSPSRQVLNFHTMDDPTPEMIMVATRLKAFGVAGIPNGKTSSLSLNGTEMGGVAAAACGTETIRYIGITHMNTSTHEVETYQFKQLVPDDMTYTIGQMGDYISFDWAPWVYSIDWDTPFNDSPDQPAIKYTDFNAIEQPIPVHQIGDFDQYTTVDLETIRKMHRTAIYSEFGVPIM